MRVLWVESKPSLTEACKEALAANGYVVECVAAAAGEECRDGPGPAAWAAIILVLESSGSDAAAMVASLRPQVQPVPVIVVAFPERIAAVEQALAAGADDFLLAPCRPEDVLLRLKAAIRRAAKRPASPIGIGDVQLNPVMKVVTRRGENVPLTAREYQLLALLMADPGRLVVRSELERQVRGSAGESGGNSIEVHVHNLRRKLGESFIRTVRGRGYRIAVDDEP